MLNQSITKLQAGVSYYLAARRVNVNPYMINWCCNGFIERDQYMYNVNGCFRPCYGDKFTSTNVLLHHLQEHLTVSGTWPAKQLDVVVSPNPIVYWIPKIICLWIFNLGKKIKIKLCYRKYPSLYIKADLVSAIYFIAEVNVSNCMMFAMLDSLFTVDK